MEKFEVKKDKAVEVRTHDRNWTVNDIFMDYLNKTEHYPVLLKSFDTEEEARAFLNQKNSIVLQLGGRVTAVMRGFIMMFSCLKK